MTSLSWDRHKGHSFGYDVVDLGLQLPDRRAPGDARGRPPRAARRATTPERAKLDEAYRKALAGIAGVEPAMPPPAEGASAHHIFTVVVDEGVDRDAVRSKLADARVQTSLHYPPIHRFSIYEGGPDLPLTDAYAVAGDHPAALSRT